MNLPQVVSRDERLIVRRRLLAEEKEFTRARDRLERRRLPMVRIDKEYVFDGPDGKATRGRGHEAGLAARDLAPPSAGNSRDRKQKGTHQ